jgi:hypothetical protein
MRCNRLSGVRVLFNLVSFVASTLAPTVAYSQALTPVQSGTRYAGTITPGFNGDFGAATTVSLNTPPILSLTRTESSTSRTHRTIASARSIPRAR